VTRYDLALGKSPPPRTELGLGDMGTAVARTWGPPYKIDEKYLADLTSYRLDVAAITGLQRYAAEVTAHEYRRALLAVYEDQVQS
jgi:hypothetical protein